MRLIGFFGNLKLRDELMKKVVSLICFICNRYLFLYIIKFLSVNLIYISYINFFYLYLNIFFIIYLEIEKDRENKLYSYNLSYKTKKIYNFNNKNDFIFFSLIRKNIRTKFIFKIFF